MAVQHGANTKDHRAFVTLGGRNWGEWEELGSPEVTMDGEVRFYVPGDSFETSGGGKYAVDSIEGQRHWKVGRDGPLVAQFDQAAVQGVALTGSVSYHEVRLDGTVDPAPYRTFDLLCTKAKAPDVNSGSEDALFEVGFSINGSPR